MFPLGAFYYLKLPRWCEEEVCQASLTFVTGKHHQPLPLTTSPGQQDIVWGLKRFRHSPLARSERSEMKVK